ncbi:MAG: hypothetical protein A2Z02_06855 [Chloroflexi bacterium RBG_16_48_7]|nr:MAG: hypothetical protein A2Z02_06855 [Chloroflexi bacterium RBG_16_48_7]
MQMVAGIVLLLMVLLTTADVTGRYFFSRPIIGTTELTEFMVIIVGFLGLAWCALKGAHLVVDLLVSRLSPRKQAAIDSFNYAMGLLFFVILTWCSFAEGATRLESGATSSNLGIPQFPFLWILGTGVAMLCLVVLAQLIQKIKKAVKG